ncbi:MAG: hypothetical protein AAFR28_17630, partial [Pseudomonadota bacterium]
MMSIGTTAVPFANFTGWVDRPAVLDDAATEDGAFFDEGDDDAPPPPPAATAPSRPPRKPSPEAVATATAAQAPTGQFIDDEIPW